MDRARGSGGSLPDDTERTGRRPRPPDAVNTLITDDEAEVAVGGVSPEFVGSKYHRTVGDEQRGMYCPDWVALVTGSSKAEYLVLAVIAYWFAASKKGKLQVREHRDGYWWLYKTYRQLAKDTRVLTHDEVRWAVRRLERKELLITRHDPAGSKPKLYRIATRNVEAAVEAAERRLEKRGRSGRRGQA